MYRTSLKPDGEITGIVRNAISTVLSMTRSNWHFEIYPPSILSNEWHFGHFF